MLEELLINCPNTAQQANICQERGSTEEAKLRNGAIECVIEIFFCGGGASQ